MAWRKKSSFGLAEISSLMFLVLFNYRTQGNSSEGRDAATISGACYNATKLK